MNANCFCKVGSLQSVKISRISSFSFNCSANLKAWGYCSNLRKICRAHLSKLVFSGSGTYGTQLKKRKKYWKHIQSNVRVIFSNILKKKFVKSCCHKSLKFEFEAKHFSCLNWLDSTTSLRIREKFSLKTNPSFTFWHYHGK